jgi:hypothetical protein
MEIRSASPGSLLLYIDSPSLTPVAGPDFRKPEILSSTRIQLEKKAMDRVRFSPWFKSTPDQR